MGLADTSNGLFGTGVNIDVVERGLRRGLRTTTKCTGEKQVFRIGENQGFLSSVGVLRCNWSDATVDLPKEVVFKEYLKHGIRHHYSVMAGMLLECAVNSSYRMEPINRIATLTNTLSMKNRSKSVLNGSEVAKRNKLQWGAKERSLRKWHNNEILFYETLGRLSSQLPTVPMFYYGKKFDEENETTGFLCMEFANKSFSTHIHECLTLYQVKEVIRALVAVQVAMHPCEGKERFNVNVYEELYSEMLQPTVLSFRLDELRSLDDSLGPLLADVDDHSKDCVSVKAFRTHHLEIGMESVFVHGDLYGSNLLWCYDQEQNLKLNKIVDWQMCHFGSPAEDLGRLLVASVSAETRLKNWEQILEFYHTEFHKRFDKEFFSIEQLKASYRQLFPTIALAFLTTLYEIFSASMKSSKDDEATSRTNKAADKVRGILEDMRRLRSSD